MSLSLSVLDLIPVRTGQTSPQAVAASIALARRADELGFTRYWFAEHHNMPSVASTAPPVMIAGVAAATSRIRVGSGGVMLPNHAPLTVAEQFATLEALAPGRIDLGLGRAPGSDPVITALLRSSGPTSDVDRFEENLRDIRALAGEGAVLSLNTSDGMREYEVKATPAADGVPEMWLLGSSDYSAHLAAKLGLPYVFAHHFSGEGTERALAIYRGEFRPSEQLEAPRTFLTLNAVVADTAEEALARAHAVAAEHGTAAHRQAAAHDRHRRGRGARGTRRRRRATSSTRCSSAGSWTLRMRRPTASASSRPASASTR